MPVLAGKFPERKIYGKVRTCAGNILDLKELVLLNNVTLLATLTLHLHKQRSRLTTGFKKVS